MHKIFKNLLSMQDIEEIRVEVKENLDLSYADQQNYKGNIFNVRRLEHENIAKLKKIITKIYNKKLFESIHNIFGKFYLMNRIEMTINGLSPATHRDGQSFGFNKNGLMKSKKIFKVILYANEAYNEHIIKVGMLDSKPIEFFKSEKYFTKVNYYIENYLKKKFLKKISLNCGDFLMFDSNTWHSPNPNFGNNLSSMPKIYIAFEFCIDKKIAEEYSNFLSNKFNQITNLKQFNNPSLENYLSNNDLFSICDIK
jgi:hypothetical protein